MAHNVNLARAAWRMRSYSSDNGGESVEVAAVWRKSSYSNNAGGECIEVSRGLPADVVALRDSKDPDGPKLAFSPAEWRAFTRRVKAGQFG